MVEFAGGSPAFLALAAAWYRRWLADPVLAHPFSHPGTHTTSERLADSLAEVGGRPGHSASFGLRFPRLSGIHPVRPPASAITAL